MRFFFNIREHDIVIEDTVGIEFRSLNAAHLEADLSIRQIVATMVLRGQPIDGEALEICSEDGTVLMVLPFKKAIILR